MFKTVSCNQNERGGGKKVTKYNTDDTNDIDTLIARKKNKKNKIKIQKRNI